MDTNGNRSNQSDLIYAGQQWITDAIAQQEEYLRRRRECSGSAECVEPVLGLSHSWETFSTAPDGPSYQACWRCRVTRSDEDFQAIASERGSWAYLALRRDGHEDPVAPWWRDAVPRGLLLVMTVHAQQVTTDELVRLAHDGDSGWSAQFGGPEGVAVLAESLRQVALQEAQDLLQVRTAAMLALLRDHRMVDVADLLGMSKQAVYKARETAQLDGRLRDLAEGEQSW